MICIVVEAVDPEERNLRLHKLRKVARSAGQGANMAFNVAMSKQNRGTVAGSSAIRKHNDLILRSIRARNSAIKHDPRLTNTQEPGEARQILRKANELRWKDRDAEQAAKQKAADKTAKIQKRLDSPRLKIRTVKGVDPEERRLRLRKIAQAAKKYSAAAKLAGSYQHPSKKYGGGPTHLARMKAAQLAHKADQAKQAVRVFQPGRKGPKPTKARKGARKEKRYYGRLVKDLTRRGYAPVLPSIPGRSKQTQEAVDAAARAARVQKLARLGRRLWKRSYRSYVPDVLLARAKHAITMAGAYDPKASKDSWQRKDLPTVRADKRRAYQRYRRYD